MESAAKPNLLLLLRQLDVRLSAWLVILMVGSALTEGIGLVLLVPMLGALGGELGAAGQIADWVAAIGIPVSLGPLLALFTGLVGLRAVINSARNLTAQRFEARVVDGLRTRAWKALLHCDWRVYSAMRQSDNTSLLITSIDRVGNAVHYMLSALALVITLAGVGAAALAISPLVALAAAAGGALVLLAYRGLRRRAATLGSQLDAAYSGIHGHMGEGLRALRVIKSLGLEDEAAGNAIASFDTLRKTQIAYLRAQGRGQILLQTAGAAALAVTVWFALTRGGAGVGEVLPLVALFARALPLLGLLQDTWQNWLHCESAIRTTFALIAHAEGAREPDPGNAVPPALVREMVLDHVSVRFSDTAAPALDDVCLAVPAGSIVALIGPSGAGKSTIADLLGGLLAPDSGTVTVDGEPLGGALRQAWRRNVAYVQQEPVLLGGTIRENLARANPAADEARIRKALADASAGFVDSLPDGLDTIVGDGGRRLSGGELQRVALARALMRDPVLLILDEATSALDAENEAAIARALAGLRNRLTILIIGHRSALVELADRTVTLDQGRVITLRDNAAG
ncbi:MAG: ABC transporter ATP-binding protein [Sphingomonadales bacterium]|nr:ABC transporter ATP-binding protein [Sphingomonadales bacterium]